MRITESDSLHDNLENQSVNELLTGINSEDAKVHQAVAEQIPFIEKFITAALEKMETGGRLFYIGAGTSGRLGILDASECPPTYGVPHGLVVGIIAGGDQAIRKAVEFAEDDTEQAFRDLEAFNINAHDFVVGISASARTPYVLGGVIACKKMGIATGCICCNKDSVIGQNADYPVEIVVGPEIITGSTRMKAGTAQKLALNTITSTVMV